MSDKKTKLELTWIGKDNRPRLEPRILLEDPELSHGTGTGKHFDNVLIKGDNLLALRALEQRYTGRVRLVYIDPPYNTGSAFEHYDDGIEHSLWLSLMRDRLEILARLLSADGSIWVQLDDNELHYCKVMLDEIMGRANFVASIVWQKVFAKKNKALISGSHDSILVYARDVSKWRRNLLGRDAEQMKAFKNPDDDPRGPWQSVAYSVQSEDSERRAAYRYPIRLPAGGEALPPAGRHWNGLPERTEALRRDNRLWFGPGGDKPPRSKVFLSEVQSGIVPDSWWTHEECGHNQDAKKEMIDLFPGVEPFGTPKPERLLQRIIEVATDPDDIVLDSFAGSGTTGAVAHKMGRRWIMVELGEHATTFVRPRLVKVVSGRDAGGVSKSLDWNGGGGFRFYRLAPSLLARDKWGNYVISETYRKGPDAGARLAEAMCKLEGFTYAPSPSTFWMHGTSTERDFIYVTTQNLGEEQVRAISEEVGENRTLLICCGAFRCSERAFPNVTLKKIPSAVLARCEWGKDDYSLNVAAVTGQEPDEPRDDSAAPSSPKDGAGKRRGRTRKPQPAQLLPLFAGQENA